MTVWADFGGFSRVVLHFPIADLNENIFWCTIHPNKSQSHSFHTSEVIGGGGGGGGGVDSSHGLRRQKDPVLIGLVHLLNTVPN